MDFTPENAKIVQTFNDQAGDRATKMIKEFFKQQNIRIESVVFDGYSKEVNVNYTSGWSDIREPDNYSFPYDEFFTKQEMRSFKINNTMLS